MGRAVFGLWMAALAGAQAQWDVVSIGGRDYVPFANVSSFYGMAAPVRAGAKGFAASGGGRSLSIALETREAAVDGVRHWLAFEPLVQNGEPYLSRMDVAKTIEPAFRIERIKGLAPVRTVVLDPGHGGHDKGARCAFGSEKDATLDVARRIRKRLEKLGIRVVMTRDSDAFVPLERRSAIAARHDNAIFVSLHFNSAAWNPAARGVEIFSLPPRGAPPTGASAPSARDSNRSIGQAVEPASFALATSVFHTLLGKLEMADRGVKRERFAVLRLARVPSILIEGGFFTNAAEAALISTSAWRDRYADAVASGISQYKRLAEDGVAPKRLADYRKAPAPPAATVASSAAAEAVR